MSIRMLIRKRFQSMLLMRGATKSRKSVDRLDRISIHAPHARSDAILARLFADALQISIHAPHARSDKCRSGGPMGDADFNPRSSCEERQMSRSA